jgi:hypothetical protein
MKTRLTTNQTALVVVVLLSVGSLLYFAWLSAPRPDDERLDRLAESIAAQEKMLSGALAESISAQERTGKILLRLAEAVGGDLANFTRATIASSSRPETKDSATYPRNAYKQWLNQLGATPTERACEERTGLTLVSPSNLLQHFFFFLL